VASDRAIQIDVHKFAEEHLPRIASMLTIPGYNPDHNVTNNGARPDHNNGADPNNNG
jgi:hypothetical protein